MHTENSVVSEEKIVSLGKRLQKAFRISEEQALEIIYEEWDLIEEAFASKMKVKEVYRKLLNELNYIGKTA